MLKDFLCPIRPADANMQAAAQKHWNKVAKPLGSLGLLEDSITKIAAITGCLIPSIGKRCLIVCCADNGVVQEGCTQTGSDVTHSMARAVADGACCVCKMAETAGVDVFPVDLGILEPLEHPNLLDRRIASGTQNIAQGPAMSTAQALQAIQTGRDLVQQMQQRGYEVVLTGELGIGNTTTSSALASVLLGIDSDRMTGRGAGLSDEGLLRKREAIRKAIQVNQPDPGDPLGTLAKLGGFDIACMVGIILGCAEFRIPVILDGVISAVAALVAVRMEPLCAQYMLASHQSAEPAGKLLLETLGLKAPIQAEMRLGEGTGAVALMPILDMALAVYSKAALFEGVNVAAYEELGQGDLPC